MKVRNYHHVYAAGSWYVPLSEHLAAMRESGFGAELRVGIVGPNPDPVIDFLHGTGVKFAVCAQASEGWEQVTLEVLAAELEQFDGATLYTHTKGAAAPSAFNDAWRRSMSVLMRNWRACVAEMEGGMDAVGCHWLTPGAQFRVDTPYFGGNFWWATNEYLRTLPPLRHDNRHEAEAWIGRGPREPKVFDWTPGWPGWEAFG